MRHLLLLLLPLWLIAGCIVEPTTPDPDWADSDRDGISAAQGDCDDFDPTVRPDSLELCNERDDDCDGEVDEGVELLSLWPDADEDGYGDADTPPVERCAAEPGEVSEGGDCDDLDPAISPTGVEICNGVDDDCDGATDEDGDFTEFWPDLDADGHGDRGGDVQAACSAPAGYAAGEPDCDDTDPTIHPLAEELCNDRDDDCDGEADDGVEVPGWYLDIDGDGAGAPSTGVASCSPLEGRIPDGGDCDDDDPSSYPGAEELCDGRDNDCNGLLDDGVPETPWYLDSDGDGFGLTDSFLVYCAQPPGFAAEPDDCDDTEPLVFPGADELCNDRDDDCDGAIDEGAVPQPWLPDLDGDGYGDDSAPPIESCEPVAGRVIRGGDCDDTDPTVHQNAPELCNGLDEDCDGLADDGLDFALWYPDRDGDGFGDEGAGTVESCSPVEDHAELPGDCDDTEPSIFPGLPESCDSRDNNCDGLIDEGLDFQDWFLDEDRDGQGAIGGDVVSACAAPEGYATEAIDCDDEDPAVGAGFPEVCDEADQDCDGVADNGLPRSLWYPDGDGDGAGDATHPGVDSCAPVDGHVEADAGDCDDGDPAIRPGAEELCDDLDNDCDGESDEGIATVDWYPDGDGDGFGDTFGLVLIDCAEPLGYRDNNLDCDDTDPTVSPDGDELCNGLDDDCNGLPDDGLEDLAWYPDTDGDGWGVDDGAPTVSCELVPDAATRVGDCAPDDPSRYPDAAELCDDVDQDCDGLVDEDFDLDADGVTTCAGDCDDTDPARSPGTEESCNAVDDDCDDDIDEGFDTDGDGVTSCAGDCDDLDPTVAPGLPELCDGLDQDCDLEIDEGVLCIELLCTDGLDDDEDGLIDCADDDCTLDPWCASVACADVELPAGAGAPLGTGSTNGEGNEWYPSCATRDRSDDLLFAWRAPSAGFWRVDSVGSDFDSTLSLHDTADCSTELLCNNNDIGNRSRIWFPALEDESFLLLLDGKDDHEGDYELNIEPFACPDIALGADNSTQTGTTTGEVDDLGSGCDKGGGGGPDVIYTWIASTSGVHTFDLSDSDYDTVLTIYEGTCSMVQLYCDHDSGEGNRSLISLDVVAGQTYTLVVDGRDAGKFGDYVLEITPP